MIKSNTWNVFYVHENCKFLIFKFSKVMQQHTWGVVGNQILVFLEIYWFCKLQQWICKSIKNWQSYSHGPLGLHPFFDSRCITIIIIIISVLIFHVLKTDKMTVFCNLLMEWLLHNVKSYTLYVSSAAKCSVHVFPQHYLFLLTFPHVHLCLTVTCSFIATDSSASVTQSDW